MQLNSTQASAEPKLSDEELADQLSHAVIYRKPEIVLNLHSLGLLDKEKGEQTLISAAKHDAVEVAEALINCGISPSCYVETNRSLNEQSTPLGIAAEYGSEGVVALLLSKKVNVDQYTHITSLQSDCTPLREALLHNGGRSPKPNIVAMLLNHGADVGKINPRGLTCLASTGDATELELLLKAGLSPNVMAEGKSLLERCVQQGKAQLALKLIEYGADVSYISNTGQTYLHKTGNAALTKVLLDKGLNVNAIDNKGRTPIECCIDKESVELMVVAGAPIDKLSMLDDTVLSSLVLTKKLIAAKKADFSIMDGQGRTPLRNLARSAILDGYLETLEYILNNVPDVDVNKAGLFGCGWTALHEAFSKNQGYGNFYNDEREDEQVAKNKYTKAIDLLIAHGAKPLKDKTGRTPLMCLTLNGFSFGYNRRVIEKYYRFEAEHYQVDPEIYKSELCKLRATGFRSESVAWGAEKSVPEPTAFKKFWQKIEAAKVSPQSKPGLGNL